jgi:hypothetical protein
MKKRHETEPFVAYRALGRGVPTLKIRTHPKTTSVEWNDCGLIWDYPEFALALDSEGMEEALSAIWKRHAPQCDRRAHFSRGRVGGYMGYVPHEAGIAAATVIREFYTKALDTLAQQHEGAPQ